MISNAILYRLSNPFTMTAAEIEAALEIQTFRPCAPTEQKTLGFAPSRGEKNGALAEFVGGHCILRLMMETKAVPAAVVKRHAQEKIEQITQSTGRKPGKKETRALMDETLIDLLPAAFPKQSASLIWIDPAAQTLLIEASSQTKADDVVSELVKTLKDFAVTPLNTQTSPAAAMSGWLLEQEAPQGFSVDRECELKACDESKAMVRYSHLALDTDEVRQHIKAGHTPTRLAMTWNDRVSFVLTESLQLKKIAFTEKVFSDNCQDGEDRFDADVAILTGELSKLHVDLVDALGGETLAGTEA